MRASAAISMSRWIELGEIDLDGVVPEGVIKRRADDLCAGRHFGIRGRVELDLVEVAGRIRHAEALVEGPSPCGPLTIQPSSEIDSNRSGPRTSSAVESGRAPHPVDEPARVGHFVDRVDVPGAQVVPLAGSR